MLLTTPQFEYLQSCVQDKAGVILPYSCMPQASLRLMPILHEHTLQDFDSLIALLHAPATRQKMETRVIERLIAPQAFFFEQYDTFKTIRHKSIPEIMARKGEDEENLRIWVPDCRRGQDAYSLSIMFNEAMPQLTTWDVEIWATDPRRQELKQARSGKFTSAEISSGIPKHLIKKSFYPYANHYRVQSRHRRIVEFYRLGLHDDWGKLCRFDLIMLRKPLSYMPDHFINELLDKMAEQLLPGGVLVIGEGAEQITHPRFELDPHLGDSGLRVLSTPSEKTFKHAPPAAPTFEIGLDADDHDEIDSEEYREIADIVRDLDLFKLMGIQEIEAICRQMQIRDYKPGKTIMREGDNHNGFYIVLNGELRVTMQTGFGRPTQELACLEIGDIVGEMSHILDEPCNATVKSLTQARLLYFSNKLFKAVLAHNAFFKDNVERIAYERRTENAKLLEETKITEPIWSEWFNSHPSNIHQELDNAAFPRGVEECELDVSAMRAFGNISRKLKLFGDISVYELEEISNRISLLKIPKRTSILKQGKEGHTLYIIYRGTTSVVLNQKFPWRGTDIATLGTGDIFGEMSLMRKTPCATTVISDGPIQAFAIGRELFDSLYKTNAYFRSAINKIVNDRERALDLMVA